LTPREAEVLFWISRGKSNYEIGIILGANVRLKKFHFVNEAGKLLAIDADGASSVVRSCCAGRALRRRQRQS
jgi:DNA-binding NarL/FixJ family response regulator